MKKTLFALALMVGMMFSSCGCKTSGNGSDVDTCAVDTCMCDTCSCDTAEVCGCTIEMADSLAAID